MQRPSNSNSFAFGFHRLDQVDPGRTHPVCERGRATDENHAAAGSRLGHASPALLGQKADGAALVAAHQGDDYEVVFFALECVDGADLINKTKILLTGITESHSHTY